MEYSLNNYTTADMLTLSWEMMKKEWKELPTTPPASNFLVEFLMDLKIRSQLNLTNVSAISLMAFLFTIHRYMFIYLIIKPITKFLNFGLRETEKFKESSCKLSCFGLFYSISYYLVNVKYPQYQYDIRTQWTGYFQSMPVPGDIQFLFICEAGYYFHAIYATYYLDVWKKDSIAMLIHHLLANCLIIFSFAVRYHRIGLIVMYLHDSADVILEATKLIICFKHKKGWRILVYLSNTGFILFSSNWFWCRLIRYPQIVLFSSLYVARNTLVGVDASFYFSFNGMLSLLLCMNVWWFHFIILLIIRIATGQSKEIEDTREYHDGKGGKHCNDDISDTKKSKLDLNGTLYCNGYVPEQNNGNLKMKADVFEPEELDKNLDGLRQRKDVSPPQ